MTVCFYIRLSSADDDIRLKAESDSVSNQRALLTQYLASRPELSGYEPVEFVDDGFSGTNGNRPAFERMIRFVRDGGSKLILCKDLSRFFRDYVEIGEYLERVFPTLGVRLLAVNDGYDSDDYKGTTAGLDVVMKCIVYSFYSRDLSQKVRTVLEAKARKGKFIGAYAPYGFLKDPEDKSHLIADPIAAKVVQRIFFMAVSGHTTGEIAKALNADHVETPAQHFHRLFPESEKFRKRVSEQKGWDWNSVIKILKREEYTGAAVSHRKNWKRIDNRHTVQNDPDEWIIVPGCHEAIVSRETYEQAQAAILGKGKYKREALDYPLRSLVRCGCCGRIMSRARGDKKRGRFYKCDKSASVQGTSCPIGERFYEADLERLVTASLSQILQTVLDEDKRLRKAAASTKGTAEHIRLSIGRLEQQMKKNAADKMAAYERYSEGEITRESFIWEKDRLMADNAALEEQRASLEKQLADLTAASSPELHETAVAADLFLGAGNVTNQMLLQFIERVNVYSGMRVEIVYKFSDPFMQSLQTLLDGETAEEKPDIGS